MTSSLVMAKCLGQPLNKTMRVLVPNLKFDTYLNMYFRDTQQILVDDNNHKCSAGDWLLVRKLDEPLSLRVNHRVERVVYKAGHVVDPLTGKQSLGYEYSDDARRQSLMFGFKPTLERTTNN